MNKENILIQMERVFSPKNINFSKWQVDQAVRIPVQKSVVPVTLCSPALPEHPHRRIARLAKRWTALAALLLGLCAVLPASASQTVSLAWNASSDPAVIGYIVNAGSTSGNYTSRLDVGTNTTVTVTGLKEGKTNYFTVSSYNSTRVPSTPSAEISYIVPGLLVMTPKATPASPVRLNFPTAAGHWYEVEASTDLKNWATIYQTSTATSNQWVGYQDSQAGSFTKRFYRIRMH